MKKRTAAASVAVIASIAALTGCSSSAPAAPASSGDSATGALSGICPSTVKVQLDWEPESDYGAIFALLGDDYTVDTASKSVSGSLVDAEGTPTGVDIEILSGGGAIGYQPVVSQLYTDPSILFGTVATDQAMAASESQPVTGVAATAKNSPYVLFWDPATHPDWTGIEDIKGSGATLVADSATASVQWLIGKGLVEESQVDTSYEGANARFVTDPSLVVQGYASNTGYLFENEIPEWGKPVDMELLSDEGYGMYPSVLSVRSDDVTAQAECLSAFVPIYQSAFVGYLADPSRVNDIIVDLVEQYDTGWTYSAGMADFASEQFASLGLMGNEADGSLGSFDTERLEGQLDEFAPILEKLGTPIKSGLTVDDFATNEFIDPSIGVPES
jgi:hypothetical protein